MKNFTKPSKKTICVCNHDVSTEGKKMKIIRQQNRIHPSQMQFNRAVKQSK